MPLLRVDIAKLCLAALGLERESKQNVQVAPASEHVRVYFECERTRRMHAKVVKILLESVQPE
jgi:hypothetical protein